MSEKIGRLSYSVPEVAEAVGCTARHIWTQVKNGDLPVFKIGTRTFVSADALQQYLAELQMKHQKKPVNP